MICFGTMGKCILRLEARLTGDADGGDYRSHEYGT